MKNIIIACGSIILSVFSTMANGQNFSWVKQIGGTGDEKIVAMKSDLQGNLIVVGNFMGTVDFDPGTGTNTKSSMNMVQDLFFAKYTSSGNLIWVKTLSGSMSKSVNDVTIDHSDNILLTGQFKYKVDFDPGANNISYTSEKKNSVSYSDDIFIAKYNKDGDFIWAATMGGKNDDGGVALDCDINNNIYTTGNFVGPIDANPGSAKNYLSGVNTFDIFISKLDSTGKYMGAWEIAGNDVEIVSDIKVTNLGSVYVVGYFNGQTDFQSGSGTYNLTSSNNTNDGFICKFDNIGTVKWAFAISGDVDQVVRNIDVTQEGNIYVSGTFFAQVDFDPGSSEHKLSSMGQSDIFIANYDTSGNYKWAVSIGGLKIETDRGILVSNGNLYCIGEFQDQVDFNPASGTKTLTAQGMNSPDAFLEILDTGGNFINVQEITGTGTESMRGVIDAANGNIYTAGFINSMTDFKPGSGTSELTPLGGNDAFIMMFSNCNSTSSSFTVTACKNYILNGVKYDSSGVYTQIISNNAGCDSVITLNLTINHVDISINYSNNSLSVGQSGATYQWIDCNNGNAPITGATSQTYSPAISGSYAAIVTFNSCTDTSVCSTVTFTGFFKTSSQDPVKIFPNPSNGIFYMLGENIRQLNIYTPDGKNIYSVNGNTNEFNISHVDSGVYFIEILTLSGVKSFSKLIKQ